eukprot:2088864-Lingulodinium_polyedra.AAC.1
MATTCIRQLHLHHGIVPVRGRWRGRPGTLFPPGNEPDHPSPVLLNQLRGQPLTVWNPTLPFRLSGGGRDVPDRAVVSQGRLT